MQYLKPFIEKRNGIVPFRDWDGRLIVTVPCGGWRLATCLEAALLPQARRLVVLRDLED